MGVFEEPNKIFLYGDNIREAEKLMGRYKDILGDIKLKDIILAHEVFHAIEWENPSLYTNTVKVEVLKIGPFRRKSIVLCAGEIAAMEFAKRVLDLNYNPILLNFLFMNIWNEEEAENLYNKLISYRR
ncbi:MAG TPA: hypothetical protein VK071_03850 [Tissierellales bacterium]|nr:hypothetical protein [Tissierellales bacterium]